MMHTTERGKQGAAPLRAGKGAVRHAAHHLTVLLLRLNDRWSSWSRFCESFFAIPRTKIYSLNESARTKSLGPAVQQVCQTHAHAGYEGDASGSGTPATSGANFALVP